MRLQSAGGHRRHGQQRAGHTHRLLARSRDPRQRRAERRGGSGTERHRHAQPQGTQVDGMERRDGQNRNVVHADGVQRHRRRRRHAPRIPDHRDRKYGLQAHGNRYPDGGRRHAGDAPGRADGRLPRRRSHGGPEADRVQRRRDRPGRCQLHDQHGRRLCGLQRRGRRLDFVGGLGRQCDPLHGRAVGRRGAAAHGQRLYHGRQRGDERRYGEDSCHAAGQRPLLLCLGCVAVRLRPVRTRPAHDQVRGGRLPLRRLFHRRECTRNPRQHRAARRLLPRLRACGRRADRHAQFGGGCGSRGACDRHRRHAYADHRPQCDDLHPVAHSDRQLHARRRGGRLPVEGVPDQGRRREDMDDPQPELERRSGDRRDETGVASGAGLFRLGDVGRLRSPRPLHRAQSRLRRRGERRIGQGRSGRHGPSRTSLYAR